MTDEASGRGVHMAGQRKRSDRLFIQSWIITVGMLLVTSQIAVFTSVIAFTRESAFSAFATVVLCIFMLVIISYIIAGITKGWNRRLWSLVEDYEYIPLDEEVNSRE
jgi:hypothetical protein